MIAAVTTTSPYAHLRPARLAHARGTALAVSRGGRLPISARWDVEVTNADNYKHWELADGASAGAAANPAARRIMRLRSRYEYDNNPWYQGIVGTVANYVIGTGPRLQVTTSDKRLNRNLERLWNLWAEEVDLPTRLETAHIARMVSGERVNVIQTNEMLENPVKLDWTEIESDQLSAPLLGLEYALYPEQYFDGLVLDRFGRPHEYHILRQHPGADMLLSMGLEYDTVPARYVLHAFKHRRPGQRRGVPELIASLPLFADLRRFTRATVGAAEVAADHAMTIETDGAAQPVVDSATGAVLNPSDVLPFDVFELESRMATVLPAGFKLGQMRAEQPTTTYEMFVDALLSQIARPVHLPLFFASLDARKANMSSAYIVTQPFARSVVVDRHGYDRDLNRTLREFCQEVERARPDDFPSGIPWPLPHVWRWPRIGQHGDPYKVAAGQETRLEAGVSSIPHECAEDGLDWEEVQEQDAAALGMSIDDYRAALRRKRFGDMSRDGQDRRTAAELMGYRPEEEEE